MKVYLSNLGCARNMVDGENMLGRLKTSGWELTPEPDTADVIIVNTCGFIESAADESIETILSLASCKTEGACKRLVVTGCLPERYREALARELPEVDFFLGTGAYDRILDAAEGKLEQGACVLPVPGGTIQTAGSAVPTFSHMAYIKIAEGCSGKCTYCIIPKLRGRQRSIPMDRIVEVAKSRISGGARELVLVAQDTTAYGKDFLEKTDLTTLLSRLADIDPDVWIRFLYGHPESIDASVAKVVAERENICSYFDIPVQHASESVLKKMGRASNRESLFRLFERIREIVPEAVLRTTVMVGFPGETSRDFDMLLDFIESVRFDHLGAFIYSDGDDLPSHHLAGHVPKKTANRRLDRLMSLQMEISEENNAKYFGKEVSVLIEEIQEEGLYVGRTMFQAPEVDGVTYVHSDQALSAGSIVDVNISDAWEYDLVGDVK